MTTVSSGREGDPSKAAVASVGSSDAFATLTAAILRRASDEPDKMRVARIDRGQPGSEAVWERVVSGAPGFLDRQPVGGEQVAKRSKSQHVDMLEGFAHR